MVNRFSECKKGNHELIVVARSSISTGTEKVVRWCRVCGAVVVDLDVDGRTNPGYYEKLRAPILAMEISKKSNDEMR